MVDLESLGLILILSFAIIAVVAIFISILKGERTK